MHSEAMGGFAVCGALSHASVHILLDKLGLLHAFTLVQCLLIRRSPTRFLQLCYHLSETLPVIGMSICKVTRTSLEFGCSISACSHLCCALVSSLPHIASRRPRTELKSFVLLKFCIPNAGDQAEDSGTGYSNIYLIESL